MAKIYASLIRQGLRTIEDVPTKIRPLVEDLLHGGNEENN